MTDEVAQRIIEDINSRQDSHQIQIIILSSNNLRRGRKWTPESVIDLYKGIIEKVAKVKNLYLILCAIVPSPLTDIRSKATFCKFNKLLKEQCALHPNFCKFFNTPKYLTAKGVVKQDLFSKDGIHLNQSGAHHLTENLMFFLKTLKKF